VNYNKVHLAECWLFWLDTGRFRFYDSVFSIWGTILYPWWFSVRCAACM